MNRLEIISELDRLFPTNGRTEEPPSLEGALLTLVEAINEGWDSLPPGLHGRIHRIEGAFNQRGKPFVLHLVKLELSEDEMDDLLGHGARDDQEI